jgi:hypothetical protein
MGRCTTSTLGRVVAVLVTISTLAACGGDDSDDAGDAAASAVADFGSAAESGDDFVGMGAEAPAATDAPAVAAAGGDGGVTAAPIDIGVVGRDVIIEMHVVLGSDDIERSVASISADAAALGGGIASSDIDYQSGADGTSSGHAVLVVKVPPEAVDRLLDGLDATGVVQSIDQSAQDVSDQLVDLDVRIANARQSVTNVRQFMESTTNLNELVALESELTRRQTELEQLEAQQRNLRDRVALSTITIEVVPTAALPEPEGERTIGGAFGDGWDAFVTFAVAVAYVIAVLAPFGAMALLVAFVLWRVRRSMPQRQPVTVRTPENEVSDDELVSASRPE